MKVADVIGARTEVFSISENTTVHEAARYLREKQVRAVGVCDARGKLLGVLSQSDISDKMAAENKCPAWMRVSEIMSTNLVTVRPDTSLDEALRLMEKHGFYHAHPERKVRVPRDARADMLESYIFPQR